MSLQCDTTIPDFESGLTEDEQRALFDKVASDTEIDESITYI